MCTTIRSSLTRTRSPGTTTSSSSDDDLVDGVPQSTHVSLDRTPSPNAANLSFGRLGVAWTVALVVYSAARALLVGPTLGPYGVDPWVFLALDVGSAFPLA